MADEIDTVVEHVHDEELPENENYVEGDENGTEQNQIQESSSQENHIENMFAKQMYMLNSDIQKGMQIMKGQMLEVVNTLMEKVDDLEKKIEHKPCGDTETGPIQSVEGGPNSGDPIAENNANENAQMNVKEPSGISSENVNSNTSGRLKIKPQIYDGKDDFDEYLAQFDIMAELNGWNYNTKSLALASSLSERARTILAELNDSKC